MKTLPALLLGSSLVLAALAFAADSTPKDAPPPAAGPKVAEVAVAQARMAAPFVLKDGAISQSTRTELDGGKALFAFTVPADGDYVVYGVVNAPAEESNSFLLNIDAPPEALMIWDVELTTGFQERMANWRGNGEIGVGQFVPKVFTLKAGAHTLHLVGREPDTQLKSISIRPAKK
jgi:hypothetical protein